MAGPIATIEAGSPCPTCGYLADPAAGPVNFCPKCGKDLRGGAAEPAPPSSLLGLVVADRYRLIAHLGEGGMGSVYKAEHVRMGKALAVKILRGDFARDPAAVERFRSEARIVSRLSHPNTIAVFDFGDVEALGGFYLAMEYVPGRDLAQVLREEGALPESRVADIGQQLLGSLAEAHEAGVIHRDVKPGNVMLMQTRPGEDFAKVLDFGIAKLRDDMAAGQTGTGAIVGTPNYLAPEQARGAPLDPRADLYAAGCLMYELLSGRAPFAGRAPMAVVNAHLHEPPPPLAAAAPGTSRRMVELVHRALAKRPDDRFSSADEMREAILALGEPTSSRSLVPAPQVTGELAIASREDFAEFDRQLRAFKRHRVAAPVLVVGLLAAAGALAWRWSDVYGLLAARAPEVAAQVPEAFRPGDRFDGEEREPNDLPGRANPLPFPARAGGTVTVKGYVGSRIDVRHGDEDVYRLEVPGGDGEKLLTARWRGEDGDGGIRGLDVQLTLHRAPAPGARTAAPLVAASDRGGPGRPEVLEARVEPGTWFLGVRERHDEATGPVEKPNDRYVLELGVRTAGADEEIEPNDGPEAAGKRASGFASWAAVAERRPLVEGKPLRGELQDRDADTFQLRAAGTTGVLLAVPAAGVALAVDSWVPAPEDLEPGGPDRDGFSPAADGAAGAPVVAAVPLAGAAPPLLRVRGAEGRGTYSLVLLAAGDGSAALALEQVRSLAALGHLPAALELAAHAARQLPRSDARAEVLGVAGALAAEAAARLGPADLAPFERAGRVLGAPIFVEEGGAVAYRGAFEAKSGEAK
ncbi:MAG TPA: serine/threonine-protein kinase [Anaeromyxobacter sp.]|nr:serine/threonine-protein kinase [Anaeromyxobacter sp.]